MDIPPSHPLGVHPDAVDPELGMGVLRKGKKRGGLLGAGKQGLMTRVPAGHRGTNHFPSLDLHFLFCKPGSIIPRPLMP